MTNVEEILGLLDCNTIEEAAKKILWIKVEDIDVPPVHSEEQMSEAIMALDTLGPLFYGIIFLNDGTWLLSVISTEYDVTIWEHQSIPTYT